MEVGFPASSVSLKVSRLDFMVNGGEGERMRGSCEARETTFLAT
jgi:hypothetical protein